MTWHCLGRTMISEPPCGSPAPEDLRKSEAIEVRFIVEDTKGNQYRSDPMSLFFHLAQTGTLALTLITPIIIGDGNLTMDFSREFYKEGENGKGVHCLTRHEG